MNRKLGVAIMVVGASMLIWTSFLPQPKDKMVATTDDNSNITYHNVPKKKKDVMSWVPYLGTILVAGGLLITVTSKRTDTALV